MVGEVPADGQVQVPGFGSVDLDGEGVEQHLRAEVGDDVRQRGRGRGAEVAGAQFHGGGQELTAPGAVLSAVAELGEHVGQQGLGLGVARFGEHHVVEDLGGPAQVAVGKGTAALGHHLVRAAHELDVAPGFLLRRVLPQPGRVAVVPAQVALVDRLDVVADRAVVAVRVPACSRAGGSSIISAISGPV